MTAPTTHRPAPADPADSAPGLLAGLTGPEQLRALPAELLPELAAELRAALIARVSAAGGHLGPNLGVVELTIALHRVFHSPHDTLLFDTGHQAYVHKMLTGRQCEFGELRRSGGLSGYPCAAESAHDVIENSHASSALAHADGLAEGYHLTGQRDRAVVALVGDGALTGGMAYEALNNLGAAPHRRVVVLLNDNGRSYAPTAGAVAAHLAGLRTGAADGPNLFERLGLHYLGPVDGHDLPALELMLGQAKALGRPVVVHAVTVKGKGYPHAEADEAEKMHAVGVIDPGTGRPAQPATALTWTDVFAEELAELGERHQELVAITAAMPGPTGLARFGERYPERCFDVGIAEQHAVAGAAGLARAGLRPVVAVYSTFLNRAYDQLLMDVALHRLPVTLVLDRAGITGPDGPSHHGMWDVSLLASVPGLRLAAPRDPAGLRTLLTEAVTHHHEGPTALRFPKSAVGPDLPALDRTGPVEVLHRSAGPEVLLVAVGPLAAECLEAARYLAGTGIGVTVADPRWVLPVPRELVSLAARHRLVVTVEDGIRSGGVGAALARALADGAVTTPLVPLGLPGRFLQHGTRAELLAAAGLTAKGIVHSVLCARAGYPAPYQS
ncbi:1-deoxy-D-xylulose-5-phosphate synthase [Kitasatospora sp. MMS16-BH015]|uniref:1-deoxy-D-xylulose-5-phosphate synthase n=1 Tax=Kitasatospora sp. MMS16-BH015 TaxID=2018025 RepID=UPI000CA1BD3C|nr:1-deoxy-D-xylulose-5-phosphate synthase [Kitasatospora sp. MMS16-BH015]AUG75644.1 1-deoxy-D-xylulose-5-phosphate synthase [Kitasatospora sp. MMS16-BH015]